MSASVADVPAAPHDPGRGPGLFGKLPSRGDFVTRRLDPVCRDILDTWLQTGILTSRRVLGDAWLRAYLNAPVWRFVCPAGACGAASLAGVMMSSLDRVGRYFPLVLAAQLPPGHGSEELMRASPWFDALEAQALAALEHETDLNELDPAVDAIGLPSAGTAGAASDDMAASDDTVFWLPSEAGPPAVVLRSGGMPTAQSFCSLLTQHWPSGGWRPVPGQATAFSLPPPVLLRAAGRTHAGTRRPLNQDALLLRPERFLWAVADGVGGHDAGEEASRAVTEHLDQLLPPLNLEGALDEVVELLTEANAALCLRAGTISDESVVASTVAVLMLLDGRAGVVWSGDSRIYRLRAGGLDQVTQDHADAHTVHHAVGAEAELVTGRATYAAWPGDRFLLCSDGLFKALSDTEIAAHLSLPTPDEAVAALIDDALVAGARDNVTAVVVHGPS